MVQFQLYCVESHQTDNIPSKWRRIHFRVPKFKYFLGEHGPRPPRWGPSYMAFGHTLQCLPIHCNATDDQNSTQNPDAATSALFDYTIAKLSEIKERKLPIIDLRNPSDASLTLTIEEQLSSLLARFIRSLEVNIHSRFDAALPVGSAFSIFDPLAFPNPEWPGFKDYGANEV